jgi:hypothetical protein
MGHFSNFSPNVGPAKWLFVTTKDLNRNVHLQLVVGYSHNKSSIVWLPLPLFLNKYL